MVEKRLTGFSPSLKDGSAVETPRSRMNTKMPHNYTPEQKERFRLKLSKIFRASPSFIDELIADERKASKIWDSLKGLAGVTAKHSSCPGVEGTTGVKMGGVVILVAAHCPAAEKWLADVNFLNAPGLLLLSATATAQQEKDLWEKLNAFFDAVILKKENLRESNVKNVTLAKDAVTIHLDSQSFCSTLFQMGIDRDHKGNACDSFRRLKGILDEPSSKCDLAWDKCGTFFKLQKKSGSES